MHATGTLTMRLPSLPPSSLKPEQKELSEDILNVVVPRFHGFVYQRDDGALIGPFNAMLHFSMFGAWAWAFKALREHSELPKPVVQLVILVTGARFGARYEIYAHEIMAEDAGLCAAKIATIVAGVRPRTSAAGKLLLTTSSVEPWCDSSQGIFKAGQDTFGDRRLAEIVFLVGCFCMVSVVLNAYDAAVPGRDDL